MATKERRKAPPGAPKYHRLTDEKRIIIEALRKEGCSKKHIAERVGCHPTTVWRELKRNVSKKGYRHKKAQGKANHRVAVKAAKRRRFTAEIWALAKDRLAKGWTFEQIHGRCKRDGIAMVCAETLYKEYYRRQKLVMAGKSDEVLPPLLRRQKKRRTRDRNANKYRNAGRGKITGRVDIDERPKTVEYRARVGNWEGDLINGLKGTGNLVTLAERSLRSSSRSSRRSASKCTSPSRTTHGKGGRTRTATVSSGKSCPRGGRSTTSPRRRCAGSTTCSTIVRFGASTGARPGRRLRD